MALDLAMVTVVPGTIQAANSPLMPTFFARSDYPMPFDSEPLVVGDTNGDGIPDLINLQYGNGIVMVQLGNGDGTFRPGPITNTVAGSSLTFIGADLNGDRIIDLVLNNATGVVICIGNGDGTFQPGAIYEIPGMNDTDLGYSVIADFNGDGIPDIATTSSSSGVWLLT
ncbi:MAG: VCBS repeat-containing protein [Bryobacteraceae bacterium]